MHNILIEFTPKQIDKFNKWMTDQNKIAIDIQKKQTPNPSEFMLQSWRNGHVYTGAIGGMYSVIVTPNSIASTIEVRHAITHNVLDLTDYDLW